MRCREFRGTGREGERTSLGDSRTGGSGPGRRHKSYKDLEGWGCWPSSSHLGTKYPDHPKGWLPMGQLWEGWGTENPKLKGRRSTYEKGGRVTQTTHHGGHPAGYRCASKDPG